jgi:mannose-6-phosphate isomerase-like protein (cupin superfamily)
VRMAPLFARPRPSAVTHGAALDFETLYPDGDLAPVRLRPHQETLLRVISGDVRLTIDRVARILSTGEEAVVPAGARHRITSLEGEARVIVGFRTA